MRPISVRGPRRLPAAMMAFALLASSLQIVSAADPPDRFKATPLKPTGTIVGDFSKAARTGGKVGVIVKLDADAVASLYRGCGRTCRRRTRRRRPVEGRLQVKHHHHYRAYLKGEQDAFTSSLGKVNGTKVTGRFDLVLNAVSAVVPADDIADNRGAPGVEAVYPDSLLQLETDVSPQFIGATDASGTPSADRTAPAKASSSASSTRGIWPEHPSFSDPDPSGKPYARRRRRSGGSRACQFSGGANPGPAFTCNNKLIGADRFMATYDAVIGLLPERVHHAPATTTATARIPRRPSAGNADVAASIFGIPRGTISGIAPRAHVEMFKVCGDRGLLLRPTRSRPSRRRSATASTSSTSRSAAATTRTPMRSSSPSSTPTTPASSSPRRPATPALAPRPPTTADRGSTTVAASTTNRAFREHAQPHRGRRRDALARRASR